MTSTDLRPMLAMLLAALLATSSPVFADDVEDAAKLLKAGQHQQAMERVNKVFAAKPKDAHDKARGALEQSIRTHPSYATAYENLGDVYAKLASQAYDKALQFDSANPAAKNKLALVKELVGGSAPAKAVVVAAAPTAPAAPVAPAAPTPPKEAAKTPAVVAAAEPAKPAVARAPAVVAAVEPAKPGAEKPAAPKAGDAEILDAVNAWAKAWSAKDVDRYLALYSKDFKTPGGEARADWEKGRRQRISAPKSITVTIDAPKVSVTSGSQASVTFRQGYRSDVIKTATTTKTLVLAKTDGRWRILYEGGA